MNNNDLEKEYSKYGIDLAEIERIISEYTGSSLLGDSEGKKAEGTEAGLLSAPSEEISATVNEVQQEAKDEKISELVDEKASASAEEKVSEPVEKKASASAEEKVSESVEEKVSEAVDKKSLEDANDKVSESAETEDTFFDKILESEEQPSAFVKNENSDDQKLSEKSKFEQELEALSKELGKHQREKKQAEKQPERLSGDESILRKRLSEAKVDSMFGLDEELFDENDGYEIENNITDEYESEIEGTAIEETEAESVKSEIDEAESAEQETAKIEADIVEIVADEEEEEAPVVEAQMEEEPSIRLSGEDSILRKRLSEAKIDDMFGLDEDLFEEDDEYEIENNVTDEFESEVVDSSADVVSENVEFVSDITETESTESALEATEIERTESASEAVETDSSEFSSDAAEKDSIEAISEADDLESILVEDNKESSSEEYITEQQESLSKNETSEIEEIVAEEEEEGVPAEEEQIEEEPSQRLSGEDSILRKRLSEAKIDDMFGLDEKESASDEEDESIDEVRDDSKYDDELFGFGESSKSEEEHTESHYESKKAEDHIELHKEEKPAEDRITMSHTGMSLSGSVSGAVSGGNKRPRVDKAKMLQTMLENNRRQEESKSENEIDEERKQSESIAVEKSDIDQSEDKAVSEDKSLDNASSDNNVSDDKASAKSDIKKETVVTSFEDKSWIERNWCWLLASGITGLFMLIFMIIAHVAPFGGNSFTMVDSMHQYVPFFSIYQEKLKHFGNLGYTWAVGGGINFQSLLLYYMASPLNLIIVLFSRKGIIAAMSLLVALKITFSAGAFSYYLSRRKGKISCNMIITGLGVAYGLNNYMAGYFWNLMWLDCIMVLPLIILGFERLMKEKDFRLYVIALFYSLFCNYYISFMICIFLILWFFAYGHGKDHEEEGAAGYYKRMFFNGLRFAGSSLLAAGMACFSLLMAYLAITKTASAHLNFPASETYGSFFDVLKAQFMLTKPITHMTYDGGVNIYCGVFAVVLFFLYIVSDKIDLGEKVRKTVLLLILFISFNNKFLNYIWHGFHDQYGIPNRFAFLFIFTLLVVAYDAVIRVKKLSPVQIIIAGIMSMALLFITYYKVDMATDISAKVILLVSHGLIITYSVILFLRNRIPNFYKKTTIILGSVMAVEILVNAGIGMGKNDVADGEYHLQHTEQIQNAMEQVSAKATETFYREELTDYIMLDENSYNNMRSLGTFCSTVRGDMVSAMGALGYYTGANEYLYMGCTPLTDDLLGVRYIYSRGDRFYPEGEQLSVVYEGDGVTVYENEDALPIAYQVNDDVLDWQLQGPRVAESLNRFAWLASGNPEIFESAVPELTLSGSNCSVGLSNDNPEYISYEVTGKEQVVIRLDMTVKKIGRYFMNIRGNYVDKVVYSINGEEKSRDRNYIQMFDMGNLKIGDEVSIDIILSDECSLDGTINFFLHTLNEDALNMLNAELSEKPFVISEFKDGYVKGKINISKGKMLMTSIPYDEGWKAYDNGKEIEVKKVGNAFIAINLSEGEHEIELKYVPDGLYIGLIVSILAWITFFILYIVRRRLTDDSKEGIIRR